MNADTVRDLVKSFRFNFYPRHIDSNENPVQKTYNYVQHGNISVYVLKKSSILYIHRGDDLYPCYVEVHYKPDIVMINGFTVPYEYDKQDMRERYKHEVPIKWLTYVIGAYNCIKIVFTEEELETDYFYQLTHFDKEVICMYLPRLKEYEQKRKEKAKREQEEDEDMAKMLTDRGYKAYLRRKDKAAKWEEDITDELQRRRNRREGAIKRCEDYQRRKAEREAMKKREEDLAKREEELRKRECHVACERWKLEMREKELEMREKELEKKEIEEEHQQRQEHVCFRDCWPFTVSHIKEHCNEDH